MARNVTINISAQDSFSAVMNRYNQAIGTAENNTRRAGQAAQEGQRGFNMMGTAIAGAVAAIGIQQVISFAEEFNQLGTTVRANSILFETLTESIGGNQRVLEMLRGATGDVVSDLHLMAGASQLLRLNIVDNADDLAVLTGQIQRLKQPTESTTDAIQNFALMLSNESLLRLDSFGISSANVKRRMDELGQSFREATMAEMAVQVERLGEAGNVAETGLARLQTKLANFWNEGAENFAIGFNAAIEGGEAFIQYINGTLPTQLAAAEANAAFVVAGTNAAEEFISGFSGQLDPLMDEQLRTFAERYAGILETVGGAGNLANRDQQVLDLARDVFQMQGLDANSDLFRQFDFLANMVEGHRELVALEREQEITAARRLEIARQEFTFRSMERDVVQQMEDADRRAAAIDPALEAWQTLAALQHEARGSIGGQALFTPEEAARAEQLANQYMVFLDEAERLHELGIIDDTALEQLKDGASTVRDMADDMQRGADAFLSMNLAEMLGTGGGGALGELTDRMVSVLEAQGLAAERIEAFRQAADLASGRGTELSQGLDPFLSSAVSTLTTDAQIQALTNLANTMAMGRQRGMEFGAEDFSRLAGMLPNGEINENFDPSFMLDAMAALERGRENGFGMPDAAADADILATNTQTAAENMGTMVEAGDDFARVVDEAAAALDEMAAKQRTLKFRTEGIPDWLQGLLSGNANSFFEVLETTVAGNGGRTPGETRTGRGSRVVERD